MQECYLTQALIHKDPRRDDLPQDFDRTLSAFLSLQHNDGKFGHSVDDVSTEDRIYRLPDDSNTVTLAVQAAFRNQVLAVHACRMKLLDFTQFVIACSSIEYVHDCM